MVRMKDGPDGHLYSEDGMKGWYKGVTTVLRSYPKGQKFYEWVAKHGYNAELIKRAAGDTGTDTHQAIEAIVQGETVDRALVRPTKSLSAEAHICVVGFERWFRARKPKVLLQETKVISHTLEVGGTVDMVVELDGGLVVVDFKTSNHMGTTFWLQLHAYAQCLYEMKVFDRSITRLAILHLSGKYDECYHEYRRPFTYEGIRQFAALRIITENAARNERQRTESIDWTDGESPGPLPQALLP